MTLISQLGRTKANNNTPGTPPAGPGRRMMLTLVLVGLLAACGAQGSSGVPTPPPNPWKLQPGVTVVDASKPELGFSTCDAYGYRVNAYPIDSGVSYLRPLHGWGVRLLDDPSCTPTEGAPPDQIIHFASKDGARDVKVATYCTRPGHRGYVGWGDGAHPDTYEILSEASCPRPKPPVDDVLPTT